MPHRSQYLAALQAAIEIRHGCRSVHRQSVLVRGHEIGMSGDREVGIFDLFDHGEAEVCFAWHQVEVAGVTILTVLADHWINSPHKAIQSTVFAIAGRGNASRVQP